MIAKIRRDWNYDHERSGSRHRVQRKLAYKR